MWSGHGCCRCCRRGGGGSCCPRGKTLVGDNVGQIGGRAQLLRQVFHVNKRHGSCVVFLWKL